MATRPGRAPRWNRRSRTFPTTPRSKISLSEVLAKRDGTAAGISYLEQFAGGDAADPELLFKLAAYYAAEQNMEKAQAVYQKIIKQEGVQPDGLKARGALAQSLLAQGDTEGAKRYVGEVLAENSGDSFALVLRGAMSLQSGDATGAIADFRGALQNQPGSAKILALLARAHLVKNEPELASDALVEALEANPTDIGVLETYVRFELARGKLARAQTRTEDFLKTSPDNLTALELLTRLQQTAKDYSGALQTVNRIKDLAPAAPGTYLLESAVQFGLGDKTAGVEALSKAYNLSDNNPKVLAQLIKAYLATDQIDQADARLDEILAAHPDNDDAMNIKGELLLFKKDYDGARALFSGILDKNPGKVLAYRNLALLELNQDKPDAAIAILEKGLENTDGSGVLTQALLSTYERTGNYARAIAKYEELLAKQPGAPLLVNNLAMLLVSGGDDVADPKRALELVEPLKTSSNSAFLDTVGWVNFKNGNLDTAVEYLAKAVEASPDAALIRYHLGMAYQAQGNKVLAVEHLDKALELQPELPQKDEINAALSALDGR